MNTATLNRNQAYTSVIGKLSQNRRQVFQVIENQPQITAEEIAQILQRPINEIVPRITELASVLLITGEASKTNPRTKMKNTTYRCLQYPERIDRINAQYVRLTDEKSQLERDYHQGISNLTKNMILKEKDKRDRQIKNLEKLFSINNY